jgi:acetoin utilization deacetylase AcuC-like enzyme
LKIFYSDHFVLPLPEGHRFPMQKYSLLRQRVVEAQLVPPEDMQIPEPAGDEQILLVHDAEYLERVKAGTLSEKEIRRIGFPWSHQMVERSRRSVGGTLGACRAALQEGIGVNLAGGTHHAYSDHGEGYCVFNDCAIAARAMQKEGLADRIAILDCDVHQGNGTAAIFQDDPSVFTFSIHGAKNFPFHKETGSLDIALPDGTGDEPFLDALQGGVQRALELADADLALYLAGADPYVGDLLGRLSVSKIGLATRDRLVFDMCRRAEIPIAVTMSGGYAKMIADTVDIHFQTVQLAVQYSQYFLQLQGDFDVDHHESTDEYRIE